MKELVTGLVQQSCTKDCNANRQKSASAIRKAASHGARLVLLQELHLGPYFCQTENPAHFDLAEPIPGPSSDLFASLAAELRIVIVASFFELRAAGLYHNTAVVFEKDGEIAGKYRKMHIPDDPGYYEKYYFTPGDGDFRPISTSVGKLGVLVCWDQWFPEAARLMALSGADLLLYPTAIGWGANEPDSERKLMLDAWTTIQRSHAIANSIPVVCANRVGFEPAGAAGSEGLLFWGNSFIAGPQGEFLAKAGGDGEQVLIAPIDMARTQLVRRNWPFLRDRRIDAYKDLSLLYRD
ncbi:MAG: carbon-nitrogen hydrolase [Syntrophobacteraceae bacterium]|nr:carbon-nitrogen hydrolase [Syntrophobacteraceae bacterium]